MIRESQKIKVNREGGSKILNPIKSGFKPLIATSLALSIMNATNGPTITPELGGSSGVAWARRW